MSLKPETARTIRCHLAKSRFQWWEIALSECLDTIAEQQREIERLKFYQSLTDKGLVGLAGCYIELEAENAALREQLKESRK